MRTFTQLYTRAHALTHIHTHTLHHKTHLTHIHPQIHTRSTMYAHQIPLEKCVEMTSHEKRVTVCVCVCIILYVFAILGLKTGDSIYISSKLLPKVKEVSLSDAIAHAALKNQQRKNVNAAAAVCLHLKEELGFLKAFYTKKFGGKPFYLLKNRQQLRGKVFITCLYVCVCVCHCVLCACLSAPLFGCV